MKVTNKMLRNMANELEQKASTRRDAERYRVVRDHAARAPGTYQSWKHLEAEQFDMAVDAATRE